MSLFRKDIECQDCDYSGESVLGLLGILLWVLAAVLFLLSWIIWPLFLIWPILVVILLVFPLGHVCPECGAKQVKKGRS
ncbi:MAG: hypothetical protein K9K64_01945 [Desulfohalobiaceae bacterium]|nr:hypothetical protein [Desulfohalobiaceae bacterium]